MGVIAWFAKHPVAANLMMVLIVVGGLLTSTTVRQEVFPEFSLDMITVSVVYRGAAPVEVEEGVCVKVEEAIQGLDGIERITSNASEGMGSVTVELVLGADSRKVLDDIKSRIDAIETFPEETEKPVVSEMTNRRQVMSVAVSGNVGELALRRLAEQVRDEVAALDGITLTELASARPYEISIEVSENALRRYGLTFDQVATSVRRSSLDLPGGAVKTAGGEILLRAKGQAYRGEEFADLVLFTRPDGTRLRVGDVAHVVDGFADTDQVTLFEGDPAILVDVFRVGDQDALDITDSIKRYLVEAQPRMPEGVTVTPWRDASRILKSRRDLLLRNGATGLLLVVFTLALFLRFRLAFWVAVGMGISFLGAMWLMPPLDVSINMVSLFAFILVLGIVVDDAIVAGENIYTHQMRHHQGLKGAIEGAREVSLPVVFAVLTSVAAFLPLLNVPGVMGKVMRVIPLIVISCLLWSLVESLWILPAHLSHYRADKDKGTGGWGFIGVWRRFQARVSDGLQWTIRSLYSPVLERALEHRYLTLSVGVATLLVTIGVAGGGYVRFVFFPEVESDYVSAGLTMAPGTPVEVTEEVIAELERNALLVRREIEERDGKDAFRYMSSTIGDQPYARTSGMNAGSYKATEISSHLGEVVIELLPAEDRSAGAAEVVDRWRSLTGPVADAVELTFSSSLFEPGEDVNVQLTGPDIDELRSAADALKVNLAGYAGVFDITDSFRTGKREIELEIKPAAELLGLTLSDLARQVRQAFYGEEAQRIQRGRDDVRVMVRYPEADRRSLGDLENMRIRTPDGSEVPFSQVAEIRTGRGYSSIKRVDRRRAVNVTADVDPLQATPGDVVSDLAARVLPKILLDHPRVQYTFEGQQAEQRDTMVGLFRGFGLALILIYALLAIPLKSYSQPLLIMAAIPFGFVGAVWGHILMGMDLTILSMFGLVALTGVVVNDSLVMVDFINRYRATHSDVATGVRMAGVARFRPILLTSMTTFAGLSPLMMERSMQARFLIPMAISLAFGVVFATFITLMLIPSGFLILEDLKRPFSRRGLRRHPAQPAEPQSVATDAVQ